MQQRKIRQYVIQQASTIPTVPDRQPLVSGLLYNTDTMFLYAPSGGFKSMVAIGLAAAVAQGKEFIGRQTTQGPVLYVDGELSQHSFKERLQLFGPSENLHILSECYQDPSSAKEREPIHVEEQEWRSPLFEAVRRNQYSLVVLDNIRTLTAGLDENDAAAITPLNNLVKSLRNLGAAVLVVHHTRKEAGNDGTSVYAGSTNFLTVYNTCIGIDRIGQDGIKFNVEKDREYSVDDAFKEQAWRLSREPGKGFVRYDGYRAEVQAMQELWNQIREGKFATRTEVSQKAKAHYKLKWKKGNMTDIKALHQLMAEEAVVPDAYFDFDRILKNGLDMGKRRREADERGETFTETRVADWEGDF